MLWVSLLRNIQYRSTFPHPSILRHCSQRSTVALIRLKQTKNIDKFTKMGRDFWITLYIIEL
jgi:hypothetical protein